jgi:hypothetical protein
MELRDTLPRIVAPRFKPLCERGWLLQPHSRERG